MLKTESVGVEEKQENDQWKRIFTFVCSMAGIAALVWNITWSISNELRGYLVLSLETKAGLRSSKTTVLASVENKGEFSKRIDYAALIVSPTGTDIKFVATELMKCSSENRHADLTNEAASNALNYIPQPAQPLYCDGEISLIPLPFFYKEQSSIGNEKLSSSVLIAEDNFVHKGAPSSAYDVRFIVTGEGHTRSTLDLLLR